MIRIEIKEISKGHAGISLEAKNTSATEIIHLGIRGIAGLVRTFMNGKPVSPELAKALGKGLEKELLDSDELKVASKFEGKEAEFMAALYGLRGKTMEEEQE